MQLKATGVCARLLLYVACQEVLCPHFHMLCFELSDPMQFSLRGLWEAGKEKSLLLIQGWTFNLYQLVDLCHN